MTEHPQAATAGQQDHTDPWAHAGEPAEAPDDCGKADPLADMPTELTQQFLEVMAAMPTELVDLGDDQEPPPHLGEVHESAYPFTPEPQPARERDH